MNIFKKTAIVASLALGLLGSAAHQPAAHATHQHAAHQHADHAADLFAPGLDAGLEARNAIHCHLHFSM